MPNRLIHLAALGAILSPVFGAAQLQQENCLPVPTARAERPLQLRQDNRKPPSKTIKIENLMLKSDTPLPRTDSEVKAELDAGPPIKDGSDWPQHLEARVVDTFQHWGYFKASVEYPHVETLSGSDQQELVNVTVKVDPGRQYRTGEIKFVKGTQFDQEQLRGFFPLGLGDVLDTYQIAKGVQRLRAAYAEKGFINFAAVPNVAPDETYGTVSFTFDLDEGPQFRVGKFEILGLDPALAQGLIEGSGMKPGSIFNPKLVDGFFERNRALLPSDAKPENNTVRTLDEQRRIVNLRMDFRRCPATTQ